MQRIVLRLPHTSRFFAVINLSGNKNICWRKLLRKVEREHHEETYKSTHNHLSHNNYRNIELLHSSHQIDSLALTQARINQLPGSWDVKNRAVSVGSSVSDNFRKFNTFTRLEKFIREPYNKQLNNRSVIMGKSQTLAYRIDQAIARSIRQGLSFRFKQ